MFGDTKRLHNEVAIGTSAYPNDGINTFLNEVYAAIAQRNF